MAQAIRLPENYHAKSPPSNSSHSLQSWLKPSIYLRIVRQSVHLLSNSNHSLQPWLKPSSHLRILRQSVHLATPTIHFNHQFPYCKEYQAKRPRSNSNHSLPENISYQAKSLHGKSNHSLQPWLKPSSYPKIVRPSVHPATPAIHFNQGSSNQVTK